MPYRFVKRGFDLFNSLLALIVLSPLFLLISIGIKLSSKGPVFYESRRVGLNGKLFTVHKFRSMHVREAGTVESKYLVNNSRIFPFGAFLRKSKLDELPQLLDIFVGNMSVVGPRPYPQSFVNRHYTGAYEKILSVRPGLSCFDSLYDYAHGELFVTDEKEYAEQVLPVRTELAKIYIEKKSLFVDAGIILRTVVLILQVIVFRKKEFAYTKYEREAVSLVSGKEVIQ